MKPCGSLLPETSAYKEGQVNAKKNAIYKQKLNSICNMKVCLRGFGFYSKYKRGRI